MHINICQIISYFNCEQDNRRDDVVVCASATLSVDLGFICLVESYQKTLKNGIRSFPAWRSAFRGGCETSWQVRLLCPWARHLTGRPHLYVEDSGTDTTKMATPTPVQMSRPKYSNKTRFLVNGK